MKMPNCEFKVLKVIFETHNTLSLENYRELIIVHIILFTVFNFNGKFKLTPV